MSRLEELIRQLCPDGVEYKPIKEEYQRLKGTPITAAKMKEIESPGGNVRIFAGGKTAIDAYEEDIPNSNIVRVPAVLVQSRGIIDAIYYEKPFTFKNEMWAYTHRNKTAIKFLYYVLKSNIGKFREAASGMGSLPQISLKVTEEFLMPVPPLEVQQEIVRILDQFTELTAELAARKKQYEYYLDNLLCKETSISNIVQLGEVCSFFNGDRGKNYPSQSDYTAFGIPFINAGDLEHGSVLIEKCKKISVQKFHSMGGAKLQKGDILYCLRGSIGKNGIFNGNYGTIASSLVAIRPHPNVCSKYIYYLLNSQLEKKQRICKDNGAAQPNLSAQSVKNYRFPLPPLSEQRRIVSILDRFDALCNNLTNDLPAEIEARRKQYEYYRDKLLTFKEVR